MGHVGDFNTLPVRAWASFIQLIIEYLSPTRGGYKDIKIKSLRGSQITGTEIRVLKYRVIRAVMKSRSVLWELGGTINPAEAVG